MAAVESETEDELEVKPAEAAAQMEPASEKEANVDEVNEQRVTGDDGVERDITPGDHVKISNDTPSPEASQSGVLRAHETSSPTALSPASTTTSAKVLGTTLPSATASNTSLDSVLALHTSRRMKPSSGDSAKPRRGVSIPSQRRFLFYWSQILSHAGPPGFWELPLTGGSLQPPDATGDLAELRRSAAIASTKSSARRVRIRELKVRMEDLGGTKATAMKLLSKVLAKAAKGKVRGNAKGKGDVWVSLARYDDGLVSLLEDWEKYTRGEGDQFGRRKPGTDHLPEDEDGEKGIAKLFESGEYDKGKMVRSFGRLGTVAKGDIIETKEDGVEVVTHTLHPLPQSEWVKISKGATPASGPSETSESATDDSVSTVSAGAAADFTQTEVDEGGITVDAMREVRVKLYMGQVPMGWIWFIPSFHMTPPTTDISAPQMVHLKLTKSDVDFHLGPGAWILDIDISLEWVPQTISQDAPPVAPQTSGTSDEPTGEGISAGLEQLTAGEGISGIVEAS